MLQVFSTDNGNYTNELTINDPNNFNFENTWVNLVNPTDREIEYVSKQLTLPEELIKAALDEEERARIELEDDIVLTLFDIPVIEDDEEHFTYATIPLGVIITNSTIVTICLKESTIINSFINNRVKGFAVAKKSRFLFQLLYRTHIKFLQHLRQIDKASQRVQNELHRSTKNKELIELLDLEKSLVYFSTSLRSNCMVIEKLKKLNQIKKYEEDLDLLEDVEIENKQAIEMCNIYRDILSGTMDAFASVISNNLNIVMKLLTTITVVLTIPTIIASFFGMNTGVPFEGQLTGFYIIVVASIIVTLVTALVITRKSKISQSFSPNKQKNKKKWLTNFFNSVKI